MSYEIRGSVFIVTGGAAGVGALTVTSLLEEGAKHVAFLDIAEEPGFGLEKQLKLRHGEEAAKFIKCDVTKDDQLFDAFESVKTQNGHIDAVINNAGIMNDSPNMYKKEIELNVIALITSTLKAIESMRKDRGGPGGTVINISSVVALTHAPLLPVYFATKSAVLHFSNCIGMEPQYLLTGVRVLSVCFGPTDTSLLQKNKYGAFDEQMENKLENFINSSHMQKPESAVKCVVEAFKRGRSASMWLSQSDQPPEDITQTVLDAHAFMKDKLHY